MAGYIYLPVPTDEMVRIATRWQTARTTMGLPQYQVLNNYVSGFRKGFLRRIGRGVLRSVGVDDTLFVLAHGAAHGSQFIGAKRDGVMKKYSAAQLAAVIMAEGLTTRFRDLHIFACGSALVAARADLAFAAAIVVEMNGLGYADLVVTGYEGAIDTGDVRRYNKQLRRFEQSDRGVLVSGTMRIITENETRTFRAD